MGNEKTELTSFSKARKWQGIGRSSCSLLAAAVKGNVTECQKTAYFIAASLLPFNDLGAEPSLTTLGMLSALKANKMSSFHLAFPEKGHLKHWRGRDNGQNVSFSCNT